MISGLQVRMARAALRWTAKDLAEKAGVSWDTIQRLESEKGTKKDQRRQATLESVERVLNEAGIEFIGADGVLYRPKSGG